MAEMTSEKRLKGFDITAEAIAETLKAYARESASIFIPDDAEFVKLWFDHERDVVTVYFSHDAFHKIIEGEPIPVEGRMGWRAK